MPSRLTYIVDIRNDDDEEAALAYLRKLRDTFISITDLAAWGYTQDEQMCQSNIEKRKDR